MNASSAAVIAPPSMNPVFSAVYTLPAPRTAPSAHPTTSARSVNSRAAGGADAGSVIAILTDSLSTGGVRT
jgi:hypothetical protein